MLKIKTNTQRRHRLMTTSQLKNDTPNRTKTSMRMRFEAEASVIRKEFGSIETVRNTLGLSRRKICQILFVDPSTWTRWTKDESKIPPLVYRSLQWYLALIEKKPIWHPQNFYSKVSEKAIDFNRIEILEKKLKSLNEVIKSLQQTRGLNATNTHSTKFVEKKSIRLTLKKLYLLIASIAFIFLTFIFCIFYF